MYTFKQLSHKSLMVSTRLMSLVPAFIISNTNIGVFAQQRRVPDTRTLCNGPCPLLGDAAGVVTDGNRLLQLILTIASFLTYLSAGVAVLVIVWGAYLWMNPADDNSAEKGKDVVINGAIGLVVAILAVTIVGVISSTLSSSNIFGNGQNPQAAQQQQQQRPANQPNVR